MPKYMEFIIEPEMIIGYEGETGWFKFPDKQENLRSKIEERRGIYLFSAEPPEINIEIYKRLLKHAKRRRNIPDIYSQITHIGGMKSSKAQSTREDIYERIVEVVYKVRDRNIDTPSFKKKQQLQEKTIIMREFSKNFLLKVYYTDSDEAKLDLLHKYKDKFGCNPPWDL